MLNKLIDAAAIKNLHDTLTGSWHYDPGFAPEGASPISEILRDLHRANYDLWHEEDKARDPNASSDVIAITKRSIDILNQRRNDLVEKIDAALLEELAAEKLPNVDAPLHSETPGLILDRLSILALKIFHTQEQIDRRDTAAAHRERNLQRMEVLRTQREDLAECLQTLWEEVAAGRRRFKLYRQLKMYNDPTLNPVLYRSGNG